MWILVVALTLLVVYWFLVRPHRYWAAKGVKQGNPTLIFGESWETATKKHSWIDLVKFLYKMFPNARYSGFYQFFIPTLLLRDPDLIKQITIKDFDHFVDRPNFVSAEADFLWAKNIFALTGQKWREMRTTLTPAFTSSKMKFMFSLISKTGKQFVNYYLEKDEALITIKAEDVFTKYTNDVFASVVFGVECDSLREPNNELYLRGQDATDFSGFWMNIRICGYLLVPKLLTLLKVQLFSTEVREFFRKMIKDNIESRERKGIVRPDMIHLLLEARKNGLKQEGTQSIKNTIFNPVEESDILTKNSKTQKGTLTDDDIVTQAFIFFWAGYDAASKLLCFMAYELAIHPEIQNRLIQEVDKTFETCKGELTYEALTDMKYMDMVTYETLRKWPNAAAVDRVCTKPYTIESKYPDEKPIHLQKNTLIWIPIYSLQMDPKYFPDPERFDPERFNDENKESIKSCTYLPFGVGPRNCIGYKFTLMETKIFFFYILSNFEIVPVEKSQIPVKIGKTRFLSAERGIWLGLKKRVKA